VIAGQVLERRLFFGDFRQRKTGHLIVAALLRHLQGMIGRAYQIGAKVVLIHRVQAAHADADGDDAVVAFPMGDRKAAGRFAQSFGKTHCRRQRAIGQDDAELLATVACRKVRRLPQVRPDRAGDGAQAVVAADMPIQMIEYLEMIDIHHHERHRRLPVLGLIELAL